MASYMLHFTASDALYERDGALFGSEQRAELSLGPFPDHIQLTYSTLRVGPDGDEVAWLVDDLWRVGRQTIPLGNGWSSFGPAPGGPVFSDVVIVVAGENE